MNPANSTGPAAYSADRADFHVVATVYSFNASFASLSSGVHGISSDFLARHTTDSSLRECSRFIPTSDTFSRYMASAVDPVLSIPVRAYNAPTHLQWRCASQPPEADVSPGEAGAVGDAAKIITNVDNQAALASARVCSPDTDGREGVLATLTRLLDESRAAPELSGGAAEVVTRVDNSVGSSSGSVSSPDTDGREGVLAALTRLLDESCAAPESGVVVGESAEVMTRVGNLVDVSSGSVSSCDTNLEELVYLSDENTAASEAMGDAEEIIAVANGQGSYRFRDAGLEVLVSRYREAAAALEQGLWQRLDEEQRLLQLATDQLSGEDTRHTIPTLETGYSSLAILRCSLLELDDEIVQNCALVERVSSARLPVVARPEEVVQSAANAEPESLCTHYTRRCYVQFSCCMGFFPCHRCHNDSENCTNKESRASDATHLKCAKCRVVQAINEDSQRCSSCKILLSEYFCAKCKHFTSNEKKPFHCEKCGICRIHMDRSFHCEVCNVCLDTRLLGRHTCRPDSGHDECCICLEDAFSGCQILPCSHKVHRECAIAMIQNGVRSCPVCRHPLYSSFVQR